MVRPSAFVCLLTCSLLFSASARAEELILGFAEGYGIPLPSPDTPAPNELKGAVAAIAQSGLDARWETVPNERLFSMLNKGPANFCLPDMYRTPERELLGIFSEPYDATPATFVITLSARADDISRHGSAAALFADSRLTFIRIAGFSYGPYLDNQIRSAAGRVETVHSDTADVPAMLLTGRGDFTFGPRAASTRVIQAYGHSLVDFAFLILPDIQGSQPMYFLCSRRIAPETLARLNDGIRRFRTSPEGTPAE
jgi:hypothetical protein